jgi:hypothetical protein
MENREPKIEQVIDEAEWSWLEPHLKRDALIVVDLKLDLAYVASLIVADDQVRIQEWIETKRIAKPSLNQIETWKKTPGKKFLSTVVQPYVLIQEYVIH